MVSTIEDGAGFRSHPQCRGECSDFTWGFWDVWLSKFQEAANKLLLSKFKDGYEICNIVIDGKTMALTSRNPHRKTCVQEKSDISVIPLVYQFIGRCLMQMRRGF